MGNVSKHDQWWPYALKSGVYIDPPRSVDKKYDDLMLTVTGNMSDAEKLKAARSICEKLNSNHSEL